MKIIAHRGHSSVAPENTLAAFEQVPGVAAGVEFDVQLTADRVPVVIHDERLERTTNGAGPVKDHTWAQLRALDAGRWFGAEFAGQRIPRLTEVLEYFRGLPLALHVELKTNLVPYPGLVQAVVGEISRLNMGAQVVVSSFNHVTLREVKVVAPELTCAALLSDQLFEPWKYARQCGFDALHVHHTVVDEQFMAGCKRAGLPVRAYTVDDAELAGRLAALEVDAVFTNRPLRIAAPHAAARL
jgi:glycerophosphoryl diester phosphodiesterase